MLNGFAAYRDAQYGYWGDVLHEAFLPDPVCTLEVPSSAPYDPARMNRRYDGALEVAERWLGPGSREIALESFVTVSDNLRNDGCRYRRQETARTL